MPYITHDFSLKTNNDLRFLRNDFSLTLKNKRCPHIHDTVRNTIEQIEQEMIKRDMPLTILIQKP